jgi:hypothetical protein
MKGSNFYKSSTIYFWPFLGNFVRLNIAERMKKEIMPSFLVDKTTLIGV